MRANRAFNACYKLAVKFLRPVEANSLFFSIGSLCGPCEAREVDQPNQTHHNFAHFSSFPTPCPASPLAILQPCAQLCRSRSCPWPSFSSSSSLGCIYPTFARLNSSPILATTSAYFFAPSDPGVSTKLLPRISILSSRSGCVPPLPSMPVPSSVPSSISTSLISRSDFLKLNQCFGSRPRNDQDKPHQLSLPIGQKSHVTSISSQAFRQARQDPTNPPACQYPSSPLLSLSQHHRASS